MHATIREPRHAFLDGLLNNEHQPPTSLGGCLLIHQTFWTLVIRQTESFGLVILCELPDARVDDALIIVYLMTRIYILRTFLSIQVLFFGCFQNNVVFLCQYLCF